MNLKLLVCLACCLALVLPSEGSYRSAAIKRLFDDLMRDESKEKLTCMSWSDQQPEMCADMLEKDPGYCEDYGLLPFCRRTCSPCGPKKLKAPAPAGVCENRRTDCEDVMHLYGINHCVEQATFAFLYCRKYCNSAPHPDILLR